MEIKKVKCVWCSHLQNTKSKLINITCSSCGKKTLNKEFINKENE